MKNKSITVQSDVKSRLNIGCGRQYHEDWTNLDLKSTDPSVICHDITKGVPFESNQFDSVYHSHILEHLTPEQGRELIEECFRVLRSGGILRIVVPDLERIARLYLETHQEAWGGDESSRAHYSWMKLELLDQMVREKSGGRMGSYMANLEMDDCDFVRSRVGDELKVCRSTPAGDDRNRNRGYAMATRITQWTERSRRKIARHVVNWLLGDDATTAFDEGLFRSQGEIHRWMYDRFSLRELCRNTGFVNFRVCRADESRIPGYSEFELDSVDGEARKPDSLFVECQKPESPPAKSK